MKEKTIRKFPGQKQGTIQVFIKRSNEEDFVQLRLNLEFEDSNTKS
ncbi:hypothetical protein [Bacillus sp. TE8-1]|nr:hypothetical protein [Bacillus sp. TE8-1]